MDLNKYKIILSNFSYLSLLELLGLFFPLITYPYLINVLGKDTYGAIVMAQSIAAYFVIIVNFGFNVSATKDISENREKTEILSNIVSTVFLLKTWIFILICIPYVSIICYTDITSYKLLYIFSLGLCIQEMYFPTWFFQGIEKMRYITLVSFVTRLSFLVLIFLCVKEEKDYLYVPLINSLGGIFASIISFYILKYKFSVHLNSVSFKDLKTTFIHSIPFFYSRFVNVVMEKSNAVLIGSFLSYADLAIYDLGVKIVGLLRIPFNLASQVLYPAIVRTKDRKMIKQMLKFILIGSFAIIFIMLFITPYTVRFLGSNQLNETTNLVYILDLVLPAVGVGGILGASTLVTFGYLKEYNLSVIYSFVIYFLIIGFMFWPFKITLYGMVIAYVVPEYMVSIYRFRIAKKYKLII